MDQANRSNKAGSNKSQQPGNRRRSLRRHSGKPISMIQEISQDSNSNHEGKDDRDNDYFLPDKEEQNKKPVKRTKSKALSELEVHSQPVSQPVPKYKKKENQGNIFLDSARIKNVFKEICDPDGYVTVDSLGHTLQKYHIDFNLRDLSEMISLLWMLKEEDIPQGSEDRVQQDEDGQLNLSIKLDFKQFQQLFRMIRAKK